MDRRGQHASLLAKLSWTQCSLPLSLSVCLCVCLSICLSVFPCTPLGINTTSLLLPLPWLLFGQVEQQRSAKDEEFRRHVAGRGFLWGSLAEEAVSHLGADGKGDDDGDDHDDKDGQTVSGSARKGGLWSQQPCGTTSSTERGNETRWILRSRSTHRNTTLASSVVEPLTLGKGRGN